MIGKCSWQKLILIAYKKCFDSYKSSSILLFSPISSPVNVLLFIRPCIFYIHLFRVTGLLELTKFLKSVQGNPKEYANFLVIYLKLPTILSFIFSFSIFCFVGLHHTLSYSSPSYNFYLHPFHPFIFSFLFGVTGLLKFFWNWTIKYF